MNILCPLLRGLKKIMINHLIYTMSELLVQKKFVISCKELFGIIQTEFVKVQVSHPFCIKIILKVTEEMLIGTSYEFFL